MATLYLTHPCLVEHDTGPGHPERPDRIRAVEKVLAHETFDALIREEAPEGAEEDIARVHPRAYIEAIKNVAPARGLVYLDGDTPMSPGTLNVILHAVGAGTRAVDAVMTGEVQNAFCGVRPPGHHAEPSRAMGFCIFNSAAIAAEYARAKHGAERVAVVDFDVHHGNGTQAAFWSEKNLFYASSHQSPFYPGTGRTGETGVAGNIVNAPLRAGDGGREFRAAYKDLILPSLVNFAPDLLILSAGFDAHQEDPLAEINLVEEDFSWVTYQLAEVAQKWSGGRIVSMLEGGYSLNGLARSTAVHVAALMDAGR
ncbi:MULTISPECIES: histone deacetylase family protein [Rhodomicrobium]|uniref:histone deacetylase family protein n=1 Tax=Rhodomicrobium TaxID=1068 RepID=UPI000B4A66A5|nr:MULTISPECIES: histone deacetylase family protein [Rhodomicrobium]